MRLLFLLLLLSTAIQAQEGPIRYYRHLQRNAALRIEGLHQITEQEAQYGKAFQMNYNLQGQLHTIKHQCQGKPCWVNDALLYQSAPFVEIAVTYGAKTIQYYFLGETWERQYQEIIHLNADGSSQRIEWKAPKGGPNQTLGYARLAQLRTTNDGAVEEALLSLSLPDVDSLIPFYTDRFQFDKLGRLESYHRLIYDYLIRTQDFNYEATRRPANGYKKTEQIRLYQDRQHTLFDSLVTIHGLTLRPLLDFLALGKLKREPAILERTTVEVYGPAQRRIVRKVSSPDGMSYREHWRYRPDGQLLEYRCKSEQDWFAVHGYAHRKMTYTDDGLLQKETFKDSEEQPASLEYRPRWDNYHWGSHGEMNFYSREFTYDEQGYLSTENRLLSKGGNMQIIYTGRESAFWERPLPKEVFYYDEADNLVWQKSLRYTAHTDSLWHPVWSKRMAIRFNKLTAYSFQDAAASPIAGPEGILEVKRFYSEDGRHLLMEWKKWPFGYYQMLYRYPILEAQYGEAYVKDLHQQLDNLVRENSPEPVEKLETIEYDAPQRYPERWQKNDAGNWEYISPAE